MSVCVDLYNNNAKYWLDKKFLSRDFQQLLLTVSPGSHVLDVGCGGGRLAITLGATADVWAVDTAADLIQKLRLSHPNIHWFAGDAQNSDAWNGLPKLDFVVSNVCIRKDQCKLEKIAKQAWKNNPEIQLLLRVQGIDDLKAFIKDSPCYSKEEIIKLLSGWRTDITEENFIQTFSSTNYLKESIGKIGLKATAFSDTKKRVAASRHYYLIRASKA